MSSICHIEFQWKVTEHFRNRIKKIWSVRTKIALIEKNISKEKIRRPVFVVYVLICPLSKFGDNRTNSIWVLAFYSVCFHWKKIDSRNSTNYVNQTGNFYFRPKLKTAISLPIYISNLFQWFLFYIRDFIWIITLTEKKIVDLKVYCNLNFPSPKARPLESDNLRSTAVRNNPQWIKLNRAIRLTFALVLFVYYHIRFDNCKFSMFNFTIEIISVMKITLTAGN